MDFVLSITARCASALAMLSLAC